MSTILLQLKSTISDETAYFDANDILIVERQQTLGSFIEEMTILKEAVVNFLEGEAVEGNLEKRSELVAAIRANERKIAAVSVGGLSPDGYEINENVKVVPITLVKNGAQTPEGAQLVLSLEEVEMITAQ